MSEKHVCPACGEEIVECESCEKTGCPDCNGFIVTRDDVILCPECGEACKEDCDKMRAVGCGSCSLFANEDDEGQGWCELHQEPVCFIDKCDDRIALTKPNNHESKKIMKKLTILFIASAICSMLNCIMFLVEGNFSAAMGWFVASCATLLLYMLLRGISRPEKPERGEYGDHIADASKMVAPTCKDSLPVGLTKREWFAGMAMAGEIAGFLAGDRGVNGEEKGVPKVIAEDAVLFADALIAELEKNNENHG